MGGESRDAREMGTIAQLAYRGDSVHPVASLLLGPIQGLAGPFDEKRR